MAYPLEFYMGIKHRLTPEDIEAFDESSGHWVAEPKLDGQWACVLTNPSGKVVVWTRNGHEDLRPPDRSMPADTIVAAERIGDTYHVFDVLMIKGEDIRNRELRYRRYRLEKLFEEFSPRFFKLVPQFKSDFAGLFEDEIANGGEGIVIKSIDSIYQHGKCPGWYKVRQTEDYTCYVDKMEGQLFLRRDYSGPYFRANNMKSYNLQVGDVVVVRGYGLSEAGIPKFASIVRKVYNGDV